MRTSMFLMLLVGGPAIAQVPPVPVPRENPVTADKAALGKILFWDEQLSSDNTVACGTCHGLDHNGTDPRRAVAPGLDGAFRTQDDVFGSLGVIGMDAEGAYVGTDVFGLDPQVTGRSAPSVQGSLWSPLTFWDGRAGRGFSDPLTGVLLYGDRGALESQAVGPILNSAEMAHAGRTWAEVTDKLGRAEPMALAGDLTPDMRAALARSPSYGALFAAAFGDPAITPARIGMAIATYERTLVADQTPWDLFMAGDTTALSAQQQRGLGAFQGSTCDVCHAPPLFTDNTFRNIGLRPIDEDEGRSAITGIPADRGRFKVPTLRNVGLQTEFMHNGALRSLEDVLNFYVNRGRQFPDNQDPAVRGINLPPPAVTDIVAFLRDGLTDPRVAAGLPPFDAPRLHATPDACRDGLDNDGDGHADLADVGCASGGDTSELAHDRVCDDGLDDDGDGLRDGADPDCDFGAFTVDPGPIFAGDVAEIHVAGAPAGQQVFLFVSTRGEGLGPCHPSAPVCLDVRSPVLVGSVAIDATGEADIEVRVPATARSGMDLWLQAVWVDNTSGAVSEVAEAAVR
ncbi:MAG TPA: cytochrome c peroxidase [Myxococcota bacterium]|nr:cytochrome c peroxidase [Myxococcota bacterium]